MQSGHDVGVDVAGLEVRMQNTNCEVQEMIDDERQEERAAHSHAA